MRTLGRLARLALVATAICGSAVALGAPGGHHGTSGADRLLGTKAGDVLKGLAGNDTLIGGRGADELIGGKGDDTLRGGPAHDSFNVRGGEQLAAPGNDTINARDGGNDEINCGTGVDTAIVDASEDGVYDCEEVREPNETQ